MRKRSPLATILATLCCVLSPGLAQAGGGLSISFDETAVIASEVTPGGPLAWFSVAREPADFIAIIVRRQEVMVDDDEDGIVVYDLAGHAVPYRSIWVAAIAGAVAPDRQPAILD
jgi:hypothetical protein